MSEVASYIPPMTQVRFPWLRAGFSGRWGGVSSAYGEPGQLNLGWTEEDDPASVAENRRRIVEKAARNTEDSTADPATDNAWNLVTMRQVHGTTVNVVKRNAGLLATPEGKAAFEGDGLITAEPGLMLATQTADCVPLLIVDHQQRTVGTFHAGWRGTLESMAAVAVESMVRAFGSKPRDMIAAIGPAIRQCCFAVSDDVRDKFATAFPYAEDKLFRTDGQTYIDLHEANRRQLLDAGLREVIVIAACTSCYHDAQGRRGFFSYRADKRVTGRMMSVAGIVQ